MTSLESTPNIAFLGIGLMGAPMARNLLAGGFAVTVWNRDSAKAEALAAAGATVAPSPAAAAKGAGTVITMLANGSAVETVMFGPQGAAESLAKGALVIDMSSSPPEMARDHAQRLGGQGVDYLDAPVSGGTVGAAEGKLAIMAGGESRVFERALPIFAQARAPDSGRARGHGPARQAVQPGDRRRHHRRGGRGAAAGGGGRRRSGGGAPGHHGRIRWKSYLNSTRQSA